MKITAKAIKDHIVLLGVVVAFLSLFYPFVHRMSLHKMKNRIKNDLTKIMPISKSNVKFTDIDEDSIGFSKDGFELRISCNNHLQLGDDEIINKYDFGFEKEAIIAYKGNWYIADFVKKFSDKESVLSHIKACENAMVEYENGLKNKIDKNLDSWEK